MSAADASVAPAGTSLGRAFAILERFTIASPLVTVDAITRELGYTRSTAYRYLRELASAGLVSQSSPGVFSLGPRIIELERLVALTDPLYRSGTAVLADERCENSALLLHNLYEDKVLCIYKQGPDVLDDSAGRITIRRARGIPFPLFQGAASLAMLPYLSAHRVRETYLRNAAAIARAGLGRQWDEFRRNLTLVRRAGFATSHGMITPRVTGVAVPILAPGGRRMLGSLARAFPTELLASRSEASFADELRPIGERIAAACVAAATRPG